MSIRGQASQGGSRSQLPQRGEGGLGCRLVAWATFQASCGVVRERRLVEVWGSISESSAAYIVFL